MKKNKTVTQNAGIATKPLLNEVGGAVKMCEHGYNGHCCCNCVHQLELYKHPMNKGEFRGSIMESTKLFCCTIFSKMDETTIGIIYDHPHGMCEMHQLRKK